MTTGVFGLGKIYKRQRLGTWEESVNYGYFGGGYSGVLSCTIDRIDFSNETTSAPGKNLTQARSRLTAVYSSNYGYFAGGWRPPISPPGTFYCTIDRLDFSTETVAVPPASAPNRLTQARRDLAAVSNSNYGYFGGGYSSSFINVCTIDRLDFSTETVAVPPASAPNRLTQARSGLSGASNPNYGYFVGGGCTIDRLNFSNETVSAPGKNLTQARYEFATVFNNYYAYFGGGDASGYTSTIRRLDFSDESTSVVGAILTQSRALLAATHSSYYGYFAGGNAPGYSSVINRIDFNTETISSPGKNVTQARHSFAGISGGKKNSVKRITTRAGIATFSGAVVSGTYGYFGGGGPSTTAEIDRLDFSTETVSLLPNQLTQARFELASVSISNYGYFGGGYGISTIDRLDFSNETTLAPGKNLTEKRKRLTAVSNPNYGYFAGGFNPIFTPPPTGFFCTVDRLDFSTETVSAPGKNLTQAREGLAGVSNINYGYFVGGSTPTTVCTIDRIDFSTETVLAPTPIQLPQARDQLAGVSNNNYGYFAGGSAPSVPGPIATINRIDFSSETISAPGKNLSQNRSSLASVSNSNYGYFGGGATPIIVCTIDRLDFSTETVSPAPGRLTESRNALAGVSN